MRFPTLVTGIVLAVASTCAAAPLPSDFSSVLDTLCGLYKRGCADGSDCPPLVPRWCGGGTTTSPTVTGTTTSPNWGQAPWAPDEDAYAPWAPDEDAYAPFTPDRRRASVGESEG